MLLHVVNNSTCKWVPSSTGSPGLLKKSYFFTSSTTLKHVNSIGQAQLVHSTFTEIFISNMPWKNTRIINAISFCPIIFLKYISKPTISVAYTCAVIWELAIRLARGLWHVAHEEVLGPTQHPLIGILAILVSNETEIRGYSDNGHDYSVICSSLYMYN